MLKTYLPPFGLAFGPTLYKASLHRPVRFTDPFLLQSKSGEDRATGKGPFYKTRADFLGKRDRQRLNKK